MFKHGFPPEWSTLKKLIWLVGSGIAGAASGIWKTVTGTLIHITDALASPMQKCEVSLEPIQDLHGQDAPYPAGGGKNKADVSKITGTYISVSNDVITITSASGSGVSTSVTFASIVPSLQVGDTCVLSYETTGTAEDHIWLRGGNVGGRWDNGDSRTLTEDDLNSTFKFYGTGTIIKFQVELGTSSTAYSPYSNICPITGWTGCEVWRTGTNVFDGHWELGALNTNTGAESPSNNDIRTGFIPVKGAREYHISWETQSLYMLFCTYHADKSFSRYFGARSANAHTWIVINDDEAYFRFYTYGNKVEPTNMHIEPDSAASSYETPNITTASVTFPDTVYGGKYEFVSGVGTNKLKKLVFNGTGVSWERLTSQNGFRTAISDMVTTTTTMAQTDDYLCDTFPKTGTQSVQFGSSSGSKNVLFKGVDSLLPELTVEAWNTWLASNNVAIVYLLETEGSFSLTPQEISTLKGVNNVWSNSNGETTLIYKAQAE